MNKVADIAYGLYDFFLFVIYTCTSFLVNIWVVTIHDFLAYYRRKKWCNLIQYKDYDENDIRKYIKKYKVPQKDIWINICRKKELSENFMRDFFQHLCWATISAKQSLSIDFIHEFKNKLNLSLVCRNQYLDEKTMYLFRRFMSYNFNFKRYYREKLVLDDPYTGTKTPYSVVKLGHTINSKYNYSMMFKWEQTHKYTMEVENFPMGMFFSTIV